MKTITLTLIIISSFCCFSCGNPKQSSGIYPTAPQGTTEPAGIDFSTNSTRSADLIDFDVNGVRLADSESEVLLKFGRPSKRYIRKIDYCGEGEILFLEYRGVEFKLVADEKGKLGVLEILVSAPYIKLSPPIQVDDSNEIVRDKLGQPAAEFEEEGFHHFGYYTKDNDNADLAFKGNKLLRVRLWINPC